jgi:hypothetical protein
VFCTLDLHLKKNPTWPAAIPVLPHELLCQPQGRSGRSAPSPLSVPWPHSHPHWIRALGCGWAEGEWYEAAPILDSCGTLSCPGPVDGSQSERIRVLQASLAWPRGPLWLHLHWFPRSSLCQPAWPLRGSVGQILSHHWQVWTYGPLPKQGGGWYKERRIWEAVYHGGATFSREISVFIKGLGGASWSLLFALLPWEEWFQ